LVLSQLNKYLFLDTNRDEDKVGDVILFQKCRLGGSNGWAKGSIQKINGKTITVTNLEARYVKSPTVTIKS
jgi:hypothetical protein